MGFLLVTAVLVVSLGRVGDIYGRVRMYNLGFAIFTLFSVLLSVTWITGVAGALWIIIMRVFQGVGGAFLFANSSAILTDAFPANERGKAMGINGIAAVSRVVHRAHPRWRPRSHPMALGLPRLGPLRHCSAPSGPI